MKKKQKENIKLASPVIIYQDDSLFIIDKPTGWVVNDAQSTVNQKTLQSWIKNYNYELNSSYELRQGIVHRLDKETSGILIIAKTSKALENLQMQFKTRQVQKTYIALLHGKVSSISQEINVPVGRLPWNRRRFGVLPGGKIAQSNLKVIGYYQNNTEIFTYVEFMPKTGRTHQLRVHSKYINHPIVGDSFYAGRKTAKKDRVWCPRTFLHAASIKFIHPQTKNTVSFKSDIPQDLITALSGLRSFTAEGN